MYEISERCKQLKKCEFFSLFRDWKSYVTDFVRMGSFILVVAKLAFAAQL